MAKKFEITEELMDNKWFDFGSMCWSAKVEGNSIIFKHCEHPREEGWTKTLSPVKLGDRVGFEARGKDSFAFIVKAPKNPRMKIMWERGFLRGHLSTEKPEPGRTWTDECLDYLNFHVGDKQVSFEGRGVRFLAVKNIKTGKMLIEAGAGRRGGTNNYFRGWWMSPDCPLEAVKLWAKVWDNDPIPDNQLNWVDFDPDKK